MRPITIYRSNKVTISDYVEDISDNKEPITTVDEDMYVVEFPEEEMTLDELTDTVYQLVQYCADEKKKRGGEA